MARQALHLARDLDQEPDARRFRIDAAGAELRSELVVLVRVAVRAQQLGQPVHLLEREAERLARLAHGAARAVADDGRRHGGAALAVAAVDVLDDLFAAIAGGQVEVDVGPLAALLGEEALEAEAHADRIARRDAERVADRAGGGPAPPLAGDAVL